LKLSAVIVTYNRNDMLKKCLMSLIDRQTDPPDEVVIVNAGDQNAQQIADEFASRGTEIKVIRTPNKSLTANRNAGIKASSYELIAFTDDDREVNPAWVKMFRDAYAEGGGHIGSMGGVVIDAAEEGLTHSIDEISMTISDYYDRKASPFCMYFRTANVCYSRKAVEEAGYFDEDFKRTSADDLDLGLKLLLAGYQNRYCPDNYIEHYGRTTLGQLLRRLFSYGCDMYKVMKRFRGTRLEGFGKVRTSVFYLISSIFTGPFVDAYHLYGKQPLWKLLFYSFILHFFVKTGVLYERIFKGGSVE